jgi:hypothetical protein
VALPATKSPAAATTDRLTLAERFMGFLRVDGSTTDDASSQVSGSLEIGRKRSPTVVVHR